MLGFHVAFGANIDNSSPTPGGHRIQYATAILYRYPITEWEVPGATGWPRSGNADKPGPGREGQTAKPALRAPATWTTRSAW